MPEGLPPLVGRGTDVEYDNPSALPPIAIGGKTSLAASEELTGFWGMTLVGPRLGVDKTPLGASEKADFKRSIRRSRAAFFTDIGVKKDNINWPSIMNHHLINTRRSCYFLGQSPLPCQAHSYLEPGLL